MILSALFSGLTAIGAHIKLDLPSGTPYTFQTGAVALAGILLGGRYGALSQLLYVAMGLVGVPVFAYGGGPHYVFRPSFGYIAGFIPGAYVTGLAAGRSIRISYLRTFIAMVLGLLIIYFFGLAHLMVQNLYLGNGKGFWEVLALGTGIYIGPDLIVLSALAKLAVEIRKRASGFARENLTDRI